MAKNLKYWDMRNMSIRLLIPTIGDILLTLSGNAIQKNTHYLVISLFILFSVFIIPIILRIYFNNWENKIITNLSRKDGRYTVIGLSSWVFIIGYIIVRIQNFNGIVG